MTGDVQCPLNYKLSYLTVFLTLVDLLFTHTKPSLVTEMQCTKAERARVGYTPACWLYLKFQTVNQISADQLPHGLRRRSAAARLLRSWVRMLSGLCVGR